MNQNTPEQKNFILNVAIIALVVFILLNILFAVLPSEQWLGKITLYNKVFPGRWRFPWSENPSKAYNISTNNLDALFAAHEVSAKPKTDDEFRIFFFGDSSIWGFLLPKEETLTAYINAASLRTSDGRIIRAYNLGYPTISITKDLLLLSEALEYQPDMILWATTLEAFPDEKQIFTPLVKRNINLTQSLIQNYDLNTDISEQDFPPESFLDRTIIGKRRPIADLMRLQLYGVMWAGTGIDQDIPESYTPLQKDYEEDDSYYNFSPPNLDSNLLALDVLQAGVEMADDIPVIIINEPIYISSGENSDIRYNFFYPRWAYDDYRLIMEEMAQTENWHYLDLWDKISPERFTNTAIHIDAQGSQQLANLIILEIQQTIETNQP